MKILVVEDNKKLASFLARALAEEGYIVDVVGDGVAAVEQAQLVPYDLMLLDWMLPEMDGLSVCRELRSKGAQVPILMLTARADVSERIAGLDAGADDFLPKPFDLGELLARVRARGRRGAATDAVTRVGPLVVDRADRRATLDGRRLDLTGREFMLLAYLAREAGRVVPRTEMLAKVWEIAFDPSSNVLEAHIRNIREKLGPQHAGLIATARGIGYRLGFGDDGTSLRLDDGGFAVETVLDDGTFVTDPRTDDGGLAVATSNDDGDFPCNHDHRRHPA